MITLYHRPKTRSSRFLWLLEELGAPYEIKLVNTRSRDGTGAIDPANPHPHGKVPAIKDSDDGTVVFESPAIVLYLTDKFPKAGIGPTVGDGKRGAYLSWLSYYTGVLEPAFMSKFMNVDVPVRHGRLGEGRGSDAVRYPDADRRSIHPGRQILRRRHSLRHDLRHVRVLAPAAQNRRQSGNMCNAVSNAPPTHAPRKRTTADDHALSRAALALLAHHLAPGGAGGALPDRARAHRARRRHRLAGAGQLQGDQPAEESAGDQDLQRDRLSNRPRSASI